MKKILIINTEIPYPLTKGGRQGVFHFIDSLRNEYEISLLFRLTEDDTESFNELKNIWNNVTFYPHLEILPQSAIKKKHLLDIYNQIYSIPFKLKDKIRKVKNDNTNKQNIDFVKQNSSLFNTATTINSERFIEYVVEISRKGFDIIQVEFYPLLSLIHILPQDVEKIFIHHEIRYIRNKIELSYFAETNEYEKYLYNVNKHYELTTLSLYDKIVTVTDIDKQKLEKELPQKVILSSPLMVNMPDNISEYQFEFNNKLTFVGSCTHFPNVDGIKWFLSEVWTIILSKNKALELHIIGGGWTKEMFEDIGLTNVFFDGFVKDLSIILPNTISIVPIRIGSGMRMKILDAINYKIPFVTTTIGVEGLDFINEKDCFISDNAIGFAESIEKLIKETKTQIKFINESYTTLHKIYNRESLIDKRRIIYTK
ncbi:glycosyltransferase family 4 protein [Dysgonomonas sp. Marseille-P4677]|uniref:glycosyltransferase family 4 protein n=1 Tax=Dysgonomonas sp. Marseille-P4677 TaxID=2364790 RepID=UPI001912C9D7|nr:glycosyltransferase family 4 protein [Dysgonomonas sp. Marseille-P4677]MBK5721753.1 glycosyltransferase family 4 protein [Dysgonomonas sp. Marseille-P4677]